MMSHTHAFSRKNTYTSLLVLSMLHSLLDYIDFEGLLCCYLHCASCSLDEIPYRAVIWVHGAHKQVLLELYWITALTLR